MVDEIELPSQLGGLKYIFTYNAHDGQVGYDPNNPNYSPGWGELTSVTLPSGARVEYDTNQDLFPEMDTNMLLPRLGKVSQKRLIYNNEYDGQSSQETETWNYAISQNGSNAITNPNGGITRQYFYSVNTDNDLSGRVYKEINPDGTMVERIWRNNKVGGCPPAGCGSMRRLNVYVKTEFTTIPDNAGNPLLTAIKDFDYDKNGNVTKITEYDWISYNSFPKDSFGNITGIPSGAVAKRITENTCYNQTEDASNTTANNANSYWNSSAPNVRTATKSTTIKQTDGTPVAHTELTYFDVNTIADLIETKVWDSNKNGTYQPYSNPLTSTNSISTTTQYDQYGNPTLATDAKVNQTQITYGNITTPTGTVNGLYPTEAKSAYNTAIQQTVQTEYDFQTGLPKKVTALGNTTNENVVAETDYDAIGRPLKVKTAVNTPLEIWTQSEYDDLNRRVIVRSDLFTKGDGKKIGIQHFDQLGRVRLTRTIEDVATQNPYNEADGIKVQTRYQTGIPNSYQVSSNPYRAATATAATNEESMGWTRSLAVSSGRHAETETFTGASLPSPWGNNTSSTGKVQTDIDADRTLISDQAGKRRISKTNALGQLTDIWEVTASDATTVAVTFPNQTITAGYQTSYQYDTLNNLTKVIQGTQANRNFTYSSLSRLLSAQNPESGTINYGYDANGNLTQKTDARSIATNYGYDALNRVLTRSYTDGVTPAVTYFYDNLPNAKGKLIKVLSSVSTTEYTGFDILGRVLAHKQTTDGNAYTTGYTYNLSGALVEETYPSGRVVKNVLDNDGDLQQVQSRKANDTFRNYANSFNYTAAGAVSSMRLGNGKWETTQFNSRLQPIQIGLGSSATNQNLLKLNYDYGTTDNNGNVKSQQITVPTVGANPGFTAIQTYTYDSLNRLKDAKEMIGTTQTWKQTFTFDRYGNRRFDEANTTTLAPGCQTAVCNPTIDPATNRLIGYTFDNAGNTKVDATGRTFTYDAENKQVEVKNSSNASIGQYFYDGDGKRVKKYVPTTGETTIFVYDASGKMVAEYSTTTNNNPQVSYLTNDHLGSPRITTDANGQVISRRDFLPFGEEITSAQTAQRSVNLNYGEDGIKQKFATYERDTETDLDFAQARMYANRLGRFTSVDPYNIIFEKKKGKNAKEENQVLHDYISNPQVWNKYAYASNNPLLYVDPQGEKAEVSVTVDEKNKTGTIVIKATFAFYAEGGTTAEQAKNAAAQIEKNIEKAWSGTFVKDGITYTVKTEVSSVMATSQADGLTKDVMNVIGLKDGQATATADSQTISGGPHKSDFGVWNINSISSGGSQHEFGHLLNINDRTSGTMLMNTNMLRSNQISRKATNDDYNWALGGSVNAYRISHVTVNDRFSIPWKGNATSTYVIRLAQSSSGMN